MLDTLKSEHLPCLTQAAPPYAQLAPSTVTKAGSFICHKKIKFSSPLFFTVIIIIKLKTGNISAVPRNHL